MIYDNTVKKVMKHALHILDGESKFGFYGSCTQIYGTEQNIQQWDGKGKIKYQDYVRHFTEGTFFHNEEERRQVLGISLQKILNWPRSHS